jgi:hypothetical protein
VAHWGTKWGAKGTRIFEETSTTLVIGFDTAWSVPEPIFAALAARYPDLLFEVDAFDEGWNFEAHGMGGAGVFTLTEGPATNEGHLRAYGELPEVEVMESPHDDTPHEEVPDPLGEGGILNIMITKFRITDEDSHE